MNLPCAVTTRRKAEQVTKVNLRDVLPNLADVNRS